MKITSILLIPGTVSTVLAFPSFSKDEASLDTRQTWEPRPFTAPGPNDGEQFLFFSRGFLHLSTEPAADEQ